MTQTEQYMSTAKGTIVSALQGVQMHIYDSKTHKSVIAHKVVDASYLFDADSCPRFLIQYGKVTRGTIAQLCFLNGTDTDSGTYVHFHIDFMPVHELASDPVIQKQSRIYGVEPMKLAEVIIECQHL